MMKELPVILKKRNKEGFTSLKQAMIDEKPEKSQLGKFILILAEHSEIDNDEERELLHYAIKNCLLRYVKTLLIFGASVEGVDSLSNLTNDQEIKCCLEIANYKTSNEGQGGHSGHSDGAEEGRISGKLFGGPSGENDFFNDARKYALNEKKGKKGLQHLLALDGGGVRGVILVKILMCIEQRLKHKEKSTDSQLIEKFDWIAGTSTGAIAAAALCNGKTLKQCLKLYFHLKNEVFYPTWLKKGPALACTGSRHCKENLETYLKKELKEKTKMKHIKDKKKNLMITTVDKNLVPLKLYMIRSYDVPHKNITDRCLFCEKQTGPECNPECWDLWQAVRCSSAAPTYFADVKGKYVDGGLVANNPTLDLLTEVHNINMASKLQGNNDQIEIGCVLSVGTGHTPKPVEDDSWFPSYLMTLLQEQFTQSHGRPVERAQSFCHSISAPFFRFSTELSTYVALDETDNERLINALWETTIYMHHFDEQIEELVTFLMATHASSSQSNSNDSRKRMSTTLDSDDEKEESTDERKHDCDDSKSKRRGGGSDDRGAGGGVGGSLFATGVGHCSVGGNGATAGGNDGSGDTSGAGDGGGKDDGHGCDHNNFKKDATLNKPNLNGLTPLMKMATHTSSSQSNSNDSRKRTSTTPKKKNEKVIKLSGNT
jgi:calcium-independent phospholipase A2